MRSQRRLEFVSPREAFASRIEVAKQSFVFLGRVAPIFALAELRGGEQVWSVWRMRALPHPPNAETDDESAEVLRAWIVDGGLEISINPSHWEHQPDQWGRLLADAAEHMADGIAKELGKDRSKVYNAIREALLRYLDHPSQDRAGEFLE